MVDPFSLAISRQVLTKSSSGNNSFGAQHAKLIPNLAHTTIKELPTLFLASPQKTNFFPLTSPQHSSSVIISANICVG